MSPVRLSPLMAMGLALLLVLDGVALVGAKLGWETLVSGQGTAAPPLPGDGAWLPPAPGEGPGYRAMPLAAFAQTTARPIFSRTRRPFVAPAPVQAPAPAGAPAAALVPLAEPAVTLSAVIIHGPARRALLITREHPGGRWVNEGDMVEGWAVSAIEADRLTLAAGARTLSVRLYLELGAGPLPAAAP